MRMKKIPTWGIIAAILVLLVAGGLIGVAFVSEYKDHGWTGVAAMSIYIVAVSLFMALIDWAIGRLFDEGSGK